MTKEIDNLMNMLGIAPETVRTTTTADSAGLMSAMEEADGEVDATSKQSLILDGWDVEKGIQFSDAEEFNKIPNREETAADFHAMYWQDKPELVEGGSINPKRDEFIAHVMNSPEYASLHVQTRHQPLRASAAAKELAKAYEPIAEEQKEREENPDADSGPGTNSMVASMRAIAEGQRAVDTVKTIEAVMGGNQAGVGAGGQSESDIRAIAEIYEELRTNEQLRRVMELAGSYRRVAQGLQRKKIGEGCEEFVGVIQDNEVARLLPVELGRLGDETLELDMLRRFVEKQTLCREYKAPAPLGKGPIVVCVDESGSMSGERIANAKAFALAMAWIAKHQNRFCLICSFESSKTGAVVAIEPGTKGNAELIKWAGTFSSGGTRMDVVVDTLPNRYWSEFKVPNGETDIIVLSDGQVPAHQDIDIFNTWKEEKGAKVIGIQIDGGKETRSSNFKLISDRYYHMSEFNLGEGGIADCLSI